MIEPVADPYCSTDTCSTSESRTTTTLVAAATRATGITKMDATAPMARMRGTITVLGTTLGMFKIYHTLALRT